MKVRDLIKMDVDIDVYDDYDERLGIAYCYGYKLTEEGEKQFGNALKLNVEIRNGFGETIALVHCTRGREAQWAKDFFESLAGFCANSDFEKWFQEIE